jgi:hypothetical protein
MHENAIFTSIKSLCDAHTPPITFSKMCVDLGLSKSLGTKLKDNPDKEINSETAQMIADYFGVSVDRVLGNEQKETPTVSGERDMEDLALLAKYREADESTRAAIRLLLKF